MNTCILACEMLEDELQAALEQTGCTWPVRYLERGLHEYPARLRERLQSEIDANTAEQIVLAFCLCGNALDGICAGKKRLIAPRLSDCIHLLSAKTPETTCIYLTAGWLRGERTMLCEHQRCLLKYGEKKTRRIYEAMLGNYKAVKLLDTGCFSHAEAEAGVKRTADTLGLAYGEARGTIETLCALVSGDWDGRFLVLEPGQCLKQAMYL